MNVEFRNICKSFGSVRANDGISLTIPSGTIHGILGENGAGKSTLLKIMSGFLRADSGEIVLDDRPVVIRSPADGIRRGIGMLHQDPLDFPPMRAVDNFLAGRCGSFFPDRKGAVSELRKLAADFDFSVDPEAYVDSLTVGERQQLEIMRLLSIGVRVLILDEPTTGISATQKEKLFQALRRLAGQGMTIVFVTHKLRDVEQLCGCVSVLRQGRCVGKAVPPFEEDALVRMMFGRELSRPRKSCAARHEAVLGLRDFSVEGRRMVVNRANLDVKGGEIIGLAGMNGSGQELILRACAGLIRPVGGQVRVNGWDLTGRPYAEFLDAGVAYLPASRMEAGLIRGLNVAEHCVLAGEQKGFAVDWQAAGQTAQQRIADFNIHATPSSLVESLSGGNQQRVLLGLLKDDLRLILLEHPTRGLDVESSIYIWEKLKERCRNGASVLFMSSDLDEILHYSDRVVVFFGGKLSAPIDAASARQETIGQMIGGVGF
jgi:simple sugar transport system ATP-binding protein